MSAISAAGSARDELILAMLDNMISCAEALGALTVENPEQGEFGKRFATSALSLAESIEGMTLRRFKRPTYMGITGLHVSGRVIDNRLADDVYCCHRINELFSTHGFTSICEIGGGFGGLAQQYLESSTDGRFTIYDLPIINVVQAFYLMKVFGGEQIRLFNEDDGGERVCILPYWQFVSPESRFDLVFNRDSMAEMPREIVLGYLQEIERKRSSLLSINQEAEAHTGDGDIRHVNVSRLARTIPFLKPVSRQRYWTRRGYIEEVFTPR